MEGIFLKTPPPTSTPLEILIQFYTFLQIDLVLQKPFLHPEEIPIPFVGGNTCMDIF